MTDLSSIFKAYDIRGKVGSELTPELVANIGRAFADWLPAEGVVAVGHDMRPDSSQLAQAFIEGLRQQGRDVWDIGQVTSDMIYFAVGKWNLAGGAVITASHNPGDDNGIKLYRDQVIAVGLKAGLADIRDATLSNTFKDPAATPGSVTQRSITEEWVGHCMGFVTGLKPYHIAIDAGNGMAGAILPAILPKLPLQVEEMYFTPDGTFPNHEANPMKVENMQDLINKVTSMGLDFGIAFDGDGDRVGFVDNRGRIISGSDMMSIMAKYYLQKYPGSTLVRDVRMSHAVDELVAQWGGKTVVVPVGRVYIGTKMREIGGPFGGEGSCHYYFKENYDADSGLIAALVAMQAISDSGKTLAELVDAYHLYAVIPETNFKVENAQATMDRLRQAFADGEQDELDGLTVSYPSSSDDQDGTGTSDDTDDSNEADSADEKWFNVRASNTEPVVRLNAEAGNEAELQEFVTKIKQVIEG